jgi:hypothetical protein
VAHQRSQARATVVPALSTLCSANNSASLLSAHAKLPAFVANGDRRRISLGVGPASKYK